MRFSQAYVMFGSILFLIFSFYLLFRKPPHPIRLSMAAIFLVLVVSFLYYAIWVPHNTRAVVSVPNVVGFPIVSAFRAIESQGLVPKVAGGKGLVEEGRVASEDPPAASHVRAGRTVLLRLEQGVGLVEVPALFGKDVEEAEKELRAVGLRLKVATAEAGGRIAFQYPPPGLRVEEGSEVEVGLSTQAIPSDTE